MEFGYAVGKNVRVGLQIAVAEQVYWKRKDGWHGTFLLGVCCTAGECRSMAFGWPTGWDRGDVVLVTSLVDKRISQDIRRESSWMKVVFSCDLYMCLS